MIKIRLFRLEDTTQIATLFHETVREINQKHYSNNQIRAWAPDNIYFRNWSEICSDRVTFVADDRGVIAGFAELELNGHIDCFYCHKNYQRQGVGKQLYQLIETTALQLKLTCLFTEASITAKPFFERMGFMLIREQCVSCRGETFTNYAMEKYLS